MGFHVAQAGIVIGVNKGQMNLEVETEAAGEKRVGKKLVRNQPTRLQPAPAGILQAPAFGGERRSTVNFE